MRCQLVLASEVAGARASEPDSAIVALAPSNRADLVLQAQLDGADIVIRMMQIRALWNKQ